MNEYPSKIIKYENGFGSENPIEEIIEKDVKKIKLWKEIKLEDIFKKIENKGK